VVLIVGLLFHGLNGIRVALVGSGIVVNRKRAMLWVGIAIGTPVLVYAGAPRIRSHLMNVIDIPRRIAPPRATGADARRACGSRPPAAAWRWWC
jgi:hypothetical protein